MKALVIFQDLSGWKVAWMKRGFRHVLVAVEIYDGAVVIVDPGSRGIRLWAGGYSLEEVKSLYPGTVVVTTANPGGSLLPTLMTCVEIAKRILGVEGFILTPYQLYRRLTCPS